MRKMIIAIVAVVGIGLLATRSFSDDKPAAAKPADAAAAAAQQAQKEAWAKVAAPGPQHEALKAMAGTFNTDVTTAMPGAPEQKSTGKSVNEIVLGGRYLQQKYEGTMDGEPFTGMGYTGYDNGKKKFVGTWMDTMSTSILQMEGTADAGGKVITMTAIYDDPMTGKPTSMRTITTIVSNDKHTFDMYMPGPDGKEFKGMTIVYTRAK